MLLKWLLGFNSGETAPPLTLNSDIWKLNMPLSTHSVCSSTTNQSSFTAPYVETVTISAHTRTSSCAEKYPVLLQHAEIWSELNYQSLRGAWQAEKTWLQTEERRVEVRVNPSAWCHSCVHLCRSITSVSLKEGSWSLWTVSENRVAVILPSWMKQKGTVRRRCMFTAHSIRYTLCFTDLQI